MNWPGLASPREQAGWAGQPGPLSPGWPLAVLQALESARIRYCLLRDSDQLRTARREAEVDLLVEAGQLARLRETLSATGFAELPNLGHWPHYFFVAYEAHSDSWLKLDVVTALSYGRPGPILHTALAAQVLANRQATTYGYTASAEDELVMLLLHCLLDKAGFAPRHRQRLLALRSEIRNPAQVTVHLNTCVSPEHTWARLAQQLDLGDWPGLLTWREAAYERYRRRHRLTYGIRPLGRRALRKLNRWSGLWRTRAPMVAVLAPDGSGKSTLVANLQASFFLPLRSIYMGLYQQRRDKTGRLPPGASLLLRMARLWRRYLSARVHQAQGRVVVFDRYTYDALLPTGGAASWRNRARRWLLAHACPPPDLVLLLDAPGAVMHARKSEHDPGRLERQRQGYLQLLDRLPPTVVLDATQSADMLRRQATAEIWRAYLAQALPTTGKRGQASGPTRPEATSRMAAGHSRNGQAERLKVAYIMSRFPKLTETFILFEMQALQQAGLDIEVYPLLRERESVIHPEARPFVEQAHYQPLLSARILWANLWFMRTRPRAYLGALGALLAGTWGSRRYFAGALAFFPKTALFARQMMVDGVDHVHAHFASHPAAAAFVIRRLTGIPYSFTAHGSDIHRDRTMLDKKVAEAAFVVSISDFNRQVILEACAGQFKGHLAVIHCGVDTDVFRPGSGRAPGASLDVLCLGTLHEVKGQTVLLEACRQLRSGGLDVRCHLIGDGPDRAALQAQVGEMGLDGAVSFHGRLARPQVVRRLQQADILVAPSVPSRDGRREGIPVALMEAMACGLPVVASRLSGIPELVIDGETGLLAPPGDAAALARAIQRLYREPQLRRRLGAAGREKVLGEFDLQTNAARLARMFGEETRQ